MTYGNAGGTAMNEVPRLVAPGSSIMLIAADSRQAVQGTVIEVADDVVRALLDEQGEPLLQRPTECCLIVISADGRSAKVAAKATPEKTLTVLHPHVGDPPERRANPRVPASALVSVQVLGRMGQALEGHLLDLSLGGCQFIRRRKARSTISKRSHVVIESILDGTYLRFEGEVVNASTIHGEDVFSVRFTSLDVTAWATVERFVDRRLQRVAKLNAVTGPVPAKVEVRGDLFMTRFDPLDGSLDLDLPVSTRPRASFRLPGVAPTLTAFGLVTDRVDGRSVIRWNRTDPVTCVLMERAAENRRTNLDAAEAPSPA